MFEQELKKALQANRPEPPRGFEERSDRQLALLTQKEDIHMKKFSGMTIAVAVLLTLTMATALAAGVIGWRRGLEDRLKVTQEIKDIYQDTQLFDSPGLSVTQNGVTVALEQCIVDPNSAYIAFRVTGYTPEMKADGPYDHEVPQFRDVRVLLDGAEPDFFCEELFFDGLDGWGLLADGSVPEDENRLPYLNGESDMVYIIHLRCDADDFSFVGKRMQVSLGGLGVDANGRNAMNVDVYGVWAFDWTLKGTDRHLSLDNLTLPVGQTGAVLTQVRLSPLYIKMTLQVPRTAAAEEEDALISPCFRGLKLKDGTVYDQLAGRGYAGYVDDSSETCRQNWELHRVIDPDQVESLLFDSGLDDSGVVEVKIQ